MTWLELHCLLLLCFPTRFTWYTPVALLPSKKKKMWKARMGEGYWQGRRTKELGGWWSGLILSSHFDAKGEQDSATRPTWHTCTNIALRQTLQHETVWETTHPHFLWWSLSREKESNRQRSQYYPREDAPDDLLLPLCSICSQYVRWPAHVCALTHWWKRPPTARHPPYLTNSSRKKNTHGLNTRPQGRALCLLLYTWITFIEWGSIEGRAVEK